MARSFDKEPVCCGVCLRQATGLGYAPKQGKPILWLCENTDCLSLGKVVFHMPPSKLSAFETWSLTDAGTAAGEYLEKIGKLSLAELNDEEWSTFLNIVLVTYGEKMRERLLNHQAPF